MLAYHLAVHLQAIFIFRHVEIAWATTGPYLSLHCRLEKPVNSTSFRGKGATSHLSASVPGFELS